MKYIILPIEKVVKFDAKGYAYPVCPVCKSDKLKVQLINDEYINMTCETDNFTLRQIDSNNYKADIMLFDYDTLSFVEKQKINLEQLFKDGFISYVDLLGYLKFGRKELDKPEDDKLFKQLEELANV